MDSITLNAPAKVNLFLKVLGRRPDGYHTIETLFEKIALFDRIRLRKMPAGISVTSDESRLPADEGNLAYRAARLLKDTYKSLAGVKIVIEKSIPIGAGLGGGSSDAASVLMGMNALYEMGLSVVKLKRLAGRIGADVPFFVSEDIWAVGRERGDRIEGIKTSMRLWHILIVPPFSVLSKDAYEWIDTRDPGAERPEINNTLACVKRNDAGALGKNLYNDLEDISLEKMDLLKGLKEMLIKYGARGALITGSGSCLFGITEDKEEVVRLRERMEDSVGGDRRKWKFFITSTLHD
ncbi:MAG: 4-(cytidine 5'-diphospho)-2-C-methyl-D-erythritol kinase [Candidatus Omnitrophica bacterium]|nr:4-(cytidine 5'-diphospho)-2-C-methyl-D-erythritol kinase [Candidatus Omnitrophota bacterium]